MEEYRKIDYTQVVLPEELLTSFAKAMLPELRKFTPVTRAGLISQHGS